MSAVENLMIDEGEKKKKWATMEDLFFFLNTQPFQSFSTVFVFLESLHSFSVWWMSCLDGCFPLLPSSVVIGHDNQKTKKQKNRKEEEVTERNKTKKKAWKNSGSCRNDIEGQVVWPLPCITLSFKLDAAVGGGRWHTLNKRAATEPKIDPQKQKQQK